MRMAWQSLALNEYIEIYGMLMRVVIINLYWYQRNIWKIFKWIQQHERRHIGKSSHKTHSSNESNNMQEDILDNPHINPIVQQQLWNIDNHVFKERHSFLLNKQYYILYPFAKHLNIDVPLKNFKNNHRKNVENKSSTFIYKTKQSYPWVHRNSKGNILIYWENIQNTKRET